MSAFMNLESIRGLYHEDIALIIVYACYYLIFCSGGSLDHRPGLQGKNANTGRSSQETREGNGVRILTAGMLFNVTSFPRGTFNA